MELTQEARLQLNMQVLDDYTLVQLALGGSQNAYTTLFNRYYRSLFHFVSRLTYSPEDARELAVEALGKAFLRIGSYVPQYSFGTWLFRIAQNCYIDYWRKRRNAHAWEAEGEMPDLSLIQDAALNAEDQMIQEEQLSLLMHRIQQLPSRYSALLQLRYLEEMRYEEIADALQMPLGTVKAQLFRARALLKEMYHQYPMAAFA